MEKYSILWTSRSWSRFFFFLSVCFSSLCLAVFWHMLRTCTPSCTADWPALSPGYPHPCSWLWPQVHVPLHVWALCLVLPRHVQFQNTKSAQNEPILVITVLEKLSAKQRHQNNLVEGRGHARCREGAHSSQEEVLTLRVGWLLQTCTCDMLTWWNLWTPLWGLLNQGWNDTEIMLELMYLLEWCSASFCCHY